MIAGRKPSSAERIFGNANPVQPISSSKRAGIPKRTPIQKRLGEYAGDTKVFSKKSDARIKAGGSTKMAYQRAGKPVNDMREKRVRSPLFPSIIQVSSTAERGGPTSMAGNIRM